MHTFRPSLMIVLTLALKSPLGKVSGDGGNPSVRVLSCEEGCWAPSAFLKGSIVPPLFFLLLDCSINHLFFSIELLTHVHECETERRQSIIRGSPLPQGKSKKDRAQK